MLRTIVKSSVSKVNFASPAVVCVRAKHTLPDLGYDYDALEPVINTEIMRLHHSKHHQTYVNNLNVAEEKNNEAVAKSDITAQISLQSALKFNGGGHINHSIFWTNLAPVKQGGGEPPKGDLSDAITRDFGSLEQFSKQFNAQTAAVQGSGWGWLGYNKAKQSLQIQTTQNQDVLTDLVPLLGIDVWEHAYYLQYKNVRPDYLTEIWKVVNWKNVAERYANARA
ncbi:Superoxide dismutase [Mn], mitochondrial [Basidiobolus ranarum]|uniref:Superoxide dismutase n=1 Tax=Basidiobolus ranarum TaxID=34480 RepID=A0ABR2VRF2_9FUNG